MRPSTPAIVLALPIIIIEEATIIQNVFKFLWKVSHPTLAQKEAKAFPFVVGGGVFNVNSLVLAVKIEWKKRKLSQQFPVKRIIANLSSAYEKGDRPRTPPPRFFATIGERSKLEEMGLGGRSLSRLTKKFRNRATILNTIATPTN